MSCHCPPSIAASVSIPTGAGTGSQAAAAFPRPGGCFREAREPFGSQASVGGAADERFGCGVVRGQVLAGESHRFMRFNSLWKLHGGNTMNL